MGNAYVLFDSVDAKNVIRNICCRRFNDRLIRIIYCEEEKFDKKNFEDNEESNNNIESNNEKNKINESWIDENNGIDIVNVKRR